MEDSSTIATLTGAMDCSSSTHPLPHAALDCDGDELAMLDCFDPDDPEMSDFLIGGGGGEFSDAVDVISLDLPPLEEAVPSAQHEDIESAAEQQGYPIDPPACADDASMCSAASGAKRPRRRSLTHAPPPPKSKPRQQHLPQPKPQLQRSSSSPVDNGSDPYNDMLTKLAASMKRSEMSRASVMQQRQYQQQGQSSSVAGMPSTPQRASSSMGVGPSTVPQFQSMVGLSGFLNGQRSTLTSGLEQSRRQLRAYMTQMNRMNSM